MNIKIESKGGLRAIPEIVDGKIMRIIGKNGIGKSMAAIFLEMATGSYRFRNEDSFLDLKEHLDVCKIILNTESDTIELNLTPKIWEFNQNFLKLEEDTIGNFKLNGKKIDLEELKKIISVKVIRGNEKFETQLKFISVIFIDLFEKYFKEIQIIIDILIEYQKRFEERVDLNTINDYYKNQQNFEKFSKEKAKIYKEYQDVLTKIRNLNEKIDLVRNIIIWIDNNPDDLKTEIRELNLKLEKSKKRADEIPVELKEIDDKIKNIEHEKRSFIREYLDTKDKYERRKLTLYRKFSKNYPEEASEIRKAEDLEFIEKWESKKYERLKEMQSQLNELFYGSQELTGHVVKKMSRIITFLDESVAEGIGDQLFIDGYFKNDLLQITFEEIRKLVTDNLGNLGKNPEYKSLEKKISLINEEVKKLNAIMGFIQKWKILLEKDNDLKRKRAEITNNSLDQLVQPEMARKLLDRQDKLLLEQSQIDMQLSNQFSKLEDLNNKLKKTKNLSSKQNLERQFREKYVSAPKEWNNLFDLMNETLKKEVSKKNGLEYTLNKINGNLDIIQKEIKNNEVIMSIAKSNNINNLMEWIRYVKNHIKRIDIVINSILEPFKDHIKNIFNICSKIERKQSIEGSPYTEYVFELYNRIFLATYKNPAFFKYLFQEYDTITQFDIFSREIVFIKLNGVEERRKLSEFSSGEKAYAFIRAMISFLDENAKYKILFVDEANALLDFIYLKELLDYQNDLIDKRKVSKIINILPIGEDPKEDSEFYIEYNEYGYYQEILRI